MKIQSIKTGELGSVYPQFQVEKKAINCHDNIHEKFEIHNQLFVHLYDSLSICMYLMKKIMF